MKEDLDKRFDTLVDYAAQGISALLSCVQLAERARAYADAAQRGFVFRAGRPDALMARFNPAQDARAAAASLDRHAARAKGAAEGAEKAAKDLIKALGGDE